MKQKFKAILKILCSNKYFVVVPSEKQGTFVAGVVTLLDIPQIFEATKGLALSVVEQTEEHFEKSDFEQELEQILNNKN